MNKVNQFLGELPYQPPPSPPTDYGKNIGKNGEKRRWFHFVKEQTVNVTIHQPLYCKIPNYRDRILQYKCEIDSLLPISNNKFVFLNLLRKDIGL